MRHVYGRRRTTNIVATSLATLVSTVAINGCGAGERAPSAALVRDSAGVTIVENGGSGEWGGDEAWRLSAEPVVDIGVFEGEAAYQLYQAMDAVRLSDGRIVIANAGTHELRFYDATGTHLRSIGREGGGPGEFQALRSVELLAGDTIVAWDWRAKRLSIFTPSGEFVRSVSPTAGMEGFGPQMHGVFADGSFVARPLFKPAAMFEQGGGRQRGTVGFPRYGYEDGALLDTIAVVPGTERYVQTAGDGISIRTIPFAREPHFTVRGDRAYVGVSDRYEIGVYDARGGLLRLVRRAVDPVAVTDADVERFTEEYVERSLAARQSDDPGARREAAEEVAAMPVPETFPAFDEIVVDVDGDLWVREYDRPAADGPWRWGVYDPDGRLLGTVETPRDLQILQIGGDFVLGRAEDELEIEHVRLYELVKPGEPATA